MIIFAVIALTGAYIFSPILRLTNLRMSEPGSTATVTTTVVTEGNYALAESQLIFTNYSLRAVAATKGLTSGAGILLHNRGAADPNDQTVVRTNFDTIYSAVVLDLTKDASLTMPETYGHYQSAWIITEEEYNPMAFVTSGMYNLSQENVGSRYALVLIRTQANMANAADIARANALQDQVKVVQEDRGSYVASDNWDHDEILDMRKYYSDIQASQNITADVMFGKKGDVSLLNHNVGAAVGWGGFTPERAVYPNYKPTSTVPQTLTLKNVPTKAFWSITIYDKDGYPKSDGIYNINSQFAKANDDGDQNDDDDGAIGAKSYTIRFGGDKTSHPNYMDTYRGWNFILRIYEPTEAYFSGEWTKPRLELVPLEEEK